MALGRHDYNVAVQVLEKASELRVERDERLADYTAGQIARFLIPGLRKNLANAVANAIARVFR